MKRLVTSLLFFIALQTQAQEALTPELQREEAIKLERQALKALRLKKCTIEYEIVEKIYESRFKGMPLPMILEFMEENEWGRHIVMEAYETPWISIPEIQRQMTTDAANRAMLECLDAVNNTNED